LRRRSHHQGVFIASRMLAASVVVRRLPHMCACRCPPAVATPHACALAVGAAAPRPAPARTSRAPPQPCAAATGYNSPCRRRPRARVAAFLMHHCCRPSSSRGPAPGPAPTCPNYPHASRRPPLKAALRAVSHSTLASLRAACASRSRGRKLVGDAGLQRVWEVVKRVGGGASG
jgi:hypothetical protein